MEDDDKELGHNELLAIIRAILEAPVEPRSFEKAIGKFILRSMGFRELQASIHPDKYQNKEEKELAQAAFKSMLSTYSV